MSYKLSMPIAVVLSACILAAGIVGAGLLIREEITRNSDELAVLRATLSTLELQSTPPSQNSVSVSRRISARDVGDATPARHQIRTEGAPALGPVTAEVLVVEFADFECPYCAPMASVLTDLQDRYGDSVRLVFKHLPLASIHPRAELAHAAAEAAYIQGKFWEMHDLIFQDPTALEEVDFHNHAAKLGLDLEQFRRDLRSKRVQDRIESDKKDARDLGIRGTPSMFINGRYFSGFRSLEALSQIVDQELESIRVSAD